MDPLLNLGLINAYESDQNDTVDFCRLACYEMYEIVKEDGLHILESQTSCKCGSVEKNLAKDKDDFRDRRH